MAALYTVRLNAKPNPDFPPRGDLPAPETVWVATLLEASEVCRRWIEEHDLGGGEWDGGQVHDHTGKPVAFVSYNGRAWTPVARWQDRQSLAL